MAARKTFLVIEPQPAEGLSVRKLVLETAFYNVLTGYSAKEGVQLLLDFPKVDAVVVHAEMKPSGEALVKKLKEIAPKLPVVLITPNGSSSYKPADHGVSSHDPQGLLEKLQEIVGPASEPPQKL
jgi:response regulator RpfG family c-di-GMP phosphodiesterase